MYLLFYLFLYKPDQIGPAYLSRTIRPEVRLVRPIVCKPHEKRLMCLLYAYCIIDEP